MGSGNCDGVGGGGEGGDGGARGGGGGGGIRGEAAIVGEGRCSRR